MVKCEKAMQKLASIQPHTELLQDVIPQVTYNNEEKVSQVYTLQAGCRMEQK